MEKLTYYEVIGFGIKVIKKSGFVKNGVVFDNFGVEEIYCNDDGSECYSVLSTGKKIFIENGYGGPEELFLNFKEALAKNCELNKRFIKSYLERIENTKILLKMEKCLTKLFRRF